MTLKTVLFFRDGFFYLTQYPAGFKNWKAEAERNPGTTKIADADGKVLWLPTVEGSRS